MIIKNGNTFHIQGKNISYIMALNECGDLRHYYFGKKLSDRDYSKKVENVERGLICYDENGWFGKRNDDDCSLGDWVVNPEKLPLGVDGLAKKINDEGLKFGLWFEPEMTNPDSDLYRTHPEWIISVPNIKPSFGRK